VTEYPDNFAPPNPGTPDYYNSLGLLYASRQQHQNAILTFQKALDLDPGCAEAFYNQALSMTAQGSIDEAIDNYSRAIGLNPDFQEAYYNLGNLYKRIGSIEKSMANYSMSIKINPNFPEAHNNLGLCLHAIARYEKAIKSFETAIDLQPGYAEAYNNLGLTLQEQGQWDLAIARFEKAIALKPAHGGAHYNLGFALDEIGKLDAAESHYRRAIQLKPDFADAHNNLGAILKRQGRTDEAIAHYRAALKHNPGKAEICNNLGNALKKGDRIDEALEMYQRALAVQPDYAEAYNNMGVALQARGNYTAALANYEKALEFKPEFAEAHFNRSTIDLLQGNFSRGWRGYEWRLNKRHWQDVYPIRHKLPRWDGSVFQGKRLLVYGEQGFGDTIQFVRYLPQVKALGGTVILETRNPLRTCLQSVDGIDEIIDQSAVGDPAKGCDLVVPLLSLPGIFGTDLQSIPARIPYLYPEAAKVAYWKKRIRGSEFNVGLVWAGNPDQENDHMRSMALGNLMVLADIPGLQLFGLQKGPAAAQLTEMPAATGLVDLGSELEDFSDTASAMANMDLIISVCTATTHLAGALGLPVWTLLSHAPDWRWMLDRNDSPWYPTMRLFRQKTAGDWHGVMDEVCAVLSNLIKSWESTGESGKKAANSFHFKKPDHPKTPVPPDRAPDLNQLGIAALGDGDPEKAQTLVARALAYDSQNPQYFYNFGRICNTLGDLPAAINAYRRAIQLKPDYIEAYTSLGGVLKDQGRFDEALDLYDQLLKLVLAEPNIPHGRGKVLCAQGLYHEAIEMFEMAISLGPANAKFYNSLGIALGLMGDQQAAIEAFEQALSLQPDLAEAVNNLGTAVQEQGKFELALNYFRRAIQLRPGYGEARFNHASIQLLLGNFEFGWKDYEGRVQQTAWRRNHTCPETISHWDGSAFSGQRLCVHSEQGLGDTIQFVRYLHLVKALGGTVILETSENLQRLLERIDGIDEIIARDANVVPVVNWDMCVNLLSLPGIFKTTLENIPSTVPYLSADSIKSRYWKEELTGQEFKVGVVWAGNPYHKKDSRRSLEPDCFAVLAGIRGIQLFGLQKGQGALKSKKVAERMNIRNLGDELYDFSDTAALIDNLDLVVSVDTAVAHLAGAMGKPVWVLLPKVPDWRWMLDRDDSPWYPTMRLFRQSEVGNWSSVLRRVAEELEVLVSSEYRGR
jgi:tetratricopeptide (TPR) repeat protein